MRPRRPSRRPHRSTRNDSRTRPSGHDPGPVHGAGAGHSADGRCLAGRPPVDEPGSACRLGPVQLYAVRLRLPDHAFMVDDFTVAYVANNSNTALPWYFKFSAVWGAHEGSL